MILRIVLLSTLLLGQDPPPKPPEPGTPPAKPAELEQAVLKLETIKRILPDGVSMTADFYGLNYSGEVRPTFVCLHMENGSRAEFSKIAPRFADFACCTLAIDLRTGKAADGVANETAASAATVLGKTTFTNEEAFVDVVEALKWARELRPTGKIFVLGSGSSAALALVAAARDAACADAVFAFSPAEDVPGWSIATEVKKISVPTYITCAGTPEEAGRARMIGNAIDKKLRKMVIPLGVQGATRGASVLVQTDPAWRDRHWSTVITMILKIAPVEPTSGLEPPTKKP